MDFSESTTNVLDRIKKIEPENASKIMGFIMLNSSEGDMIRLAFGPDKLIHDKVMEAKLGLAAISNQNVSIAPLSPTISPAPLSELPLQYAQFPSALPRLFPSATTFAVPSAVHWDPQLAPDQEGLVNPVGYPDPPVADDYRIQNQTHFLNFEDQLDPNSGGLGGFLGDYYLPDGSLSNLNAGASLRSPSLPDFPLNGKTCHYFNKGFCKHGSNCRYLHGHSQMLGPNELYGDDHVFSPGSLDKLEVEITELLRSRRGAPVSIASLPMLYYEYFGRTLQAEGYLTESQRHGRAGYSLTKLLARLKGIRLIDRAHGQHSVILAEDAAKYDTDNYSDRKDPGPIVNGSRQIYLTFPAESTFSEEDVSNYFSAFGPVEDVRIPCQQKRMFGFVTFASANTVKTVLAKGNPHFVCGSRVLVKPYREKSKPIIRKYMDKHDGNTYYSRSYGDFEPEFHSPNKYSYSMPRVCRAPRFLWKQLEEQEQVFELERKLMELQLAENPVSNQPSLGYNLDELKVAEDNSQELSQLLHIFNNDYPDQESQGINFQENAFTSAVASNMSTVM